MYKIYFNDKVIIFDSNTDGYNENEAIKVGPKDGTILRKEAEELWQKYATIVVGADDPQAALLNFTGQFLSIEAAGGLVSDKEGNILMIFRNNRWDLPKGKIEEGEHPQVCGVREVEEECGITGPQAQEKLTDTYHIYLMFGQPVIKKTHWYRMQYTGIEQLVPQLEENITAIRWVPPEKIDQFLQSSYPAILDVFKAAGYHIR